MPRYVFQAYVVKNGTIDTSKKVTITSNDRNGYQNSTVYKNVTYIGSDEIDGKLTYPTSGFSKGDKVTIQIETSLNIKYGGPIFYSIDMYVDGLYYKQITHYTTQTIYTATIPQSAKKNCDFRLVTQDNSGYSNDTYGPVITLSDSISTTGKEFYIGIGDKARKAKSFYIGINNKARKIKKAYIGIDNKARLFYEDNTTSGSVTPPVDPDPVEPDPVEPDPPVDTNKYIWTNMTKLKNVYGSSNNIYMELIKDGRGFQAITEEGKYYTSTGATVWVGGGSGATVSSVLDKPTSICYCEGIAYAVNDKVGNQSSSLFVDKNFARKYSTDYFCFVTPIPLSVVSGCKKSDRIVGINNSQSKALYTDDFANTTSWKTVNVPNTGNIWKKIAYSDNTIVAIGTSSSGGATTAALYTTDYGVTWKKTTIPSGAYVSIIYAGGKFIAVAKNSNKIAYSTDGISWNSATLPNSANWSGVAYSDSSRYTHRYIVVARNSNICALSEDGITWYSNTLPASNDWINIAHNENIFFILARDGNALYTAG